MKKFTTYDEDGRQVMGIAHLTQRVRSANKKAFSNGSKSVEDEKNCFLNHFNLSGDDTTNIETLYFQTVFDVTNFLTRIRVFKTPCVINIIIYLVIQKRTF